MEKINLTEILKNCPKGTKLYSTLCGEVELIKASSSLKYPIVVKTSTNNLINFTKYGQYYMGNGECLLFPSKENRDWNTFKPKKPKFDPESFKPFDKVLARKKYEMWYADFISLPIDGLNTVPCIISDKDFNTVIPYNDDTKHLLCTTNDAPEYYRYWED